METEVAQLNNINSIKELVVYLTQIPKSKHITVNIYLQSIGNITDSIVTGTNVTTAMQR